MPRKLSPHPMRGAGASGITTRFQELFRSMGQVGHALLTRSPLSPASKARRIPFDLHVLSTPPAFILSQNRTLHKKTMRKAKNRLSQNKIDDRLIRKGDSHENPDPHQPPSRTPPQDNQKPHTEAGTGLAIIDYKRSSTDTLLSSQTTTTHPTNRTPRRKPAGERQQENNIHHHPHPRNPTTTKHPTNPRKTNQTPACRKHTQQHPTQHNQHNQPQQQRQRTQQSNLAVL